MLGNAPKSHGPMPTLRILVKVVPEEEVPVAHEEVGVVVDEEAGVVRVEDGRILAVVDEETVLEGVGDGRIPEAMISPYYNLFSNCNHIVTYSKPFCNLSASSK